METFIAKLLESVAVCGHAYATPAGARLSSFWQTTKRINGNKVALVLTYLNEYMSAYIGRGLPTLFDGRILAIAQEASTHSPRKMDESQVSHKTGGGGESDLSLAQYGRAIRSETLRLFAVESVGGSSI